MAAILALNIIPHPLHALHRAGRIPLRAALPEAHSTQIFESGNKETAIFYPVLPATTSVIDSADPALGWVSRLGNQVLSGYITDEAGGHFTHPDGMTLIIFSQDGSDIRTNAYLDPATGFYQIILGYFTYNSRSLLAKQLDKDWDIAYRGFPQDDVIDGTRLIPDRGLAFTLSDIGKDQCPRAVAFVDSLVTY